jgi:putative peptidoglycan lipid II flippase
LQQIAVLVVPSTVGYLLLPDVIVGGIYQRGRFDSAETLLVSLVLAAYTIGLLASTATRLFSSAFFALQDTRTPARIAYVRVGISAALAGLITLWVRYGNPAHARYGPVGLAAASGLAAWVEWSLLRKRLHVHLPGVGLGRKLLVKLLLIAGVAALVARGLEFVLPEWNPLLIAAIVMPPYALIYLVTVHMLGIEARIPLIGRFLPKRK